MKRSEADYQSIRGWMYRNARPLDLARWQYHFENGSQENVLAALSAYQNADGGFGRAIEPDFWNPNSSPYAASVAVNILEEIHFRDSSHPLIQKTLRYLECAPEFDGERWPAAIPSHANYPHAPWWTDASYDWGCTPTALLAGFLLLHAGEDEPIYQTARKIAETAVDRYLHGTMPDGQPYNRVRREGEIHGMVMLLAFIEEKGLGPEFPLAETRSVLKEQAETFYEKDPAKWTQYCWKPSNFIHSPDSLFYPGAEQAIETELTYILSKRNAEGIWDITWSWGAYEKEFAIAENWWKANIIIEHLRMLRSFGRL